MSLPPSVWSAVPLFRIFAKCVLALKLVAGCCSVKKKPYRMVPDSDGKVAVERFHGQSDWVFRGADRGAMSRRYWMQALWWPLVQSAGQQILGCTGPGSYAVAAFVVQGAVLTSVRSVWYIALCRHVCLESLRAV